MRRVLVAQGFLVQDAVRISHDDFEIVTTRGKVVWRFRCKSSCVHLAQVASNADTFARYKRIVVRALERGLAQGLGWEHLLKERMALDNVKHILISEFPVVANNHSIIWIGEIS